MNWARSMAWAPMSPSAPEPACSFCRRHASGRGLVDEPVLQVLGAHAAHVADGAARDEVAGERGRRNAAVGESDHREDAAGRGALGGGGHDLGLGDGVGERLLAEHVLAGLEGGDRDLGVRVAGGHDVDDVDVVAGDRLAPVGGGLRPAPLLGGGMPRPPPLRPTSSAISGVAGRSKNLGATRQPCECAAPMNP